MAPRNTPISAPADDASAGNADSPMAANANAATDTADQAPAPIVNDYGGFAIAPGPGTVIHNPAPGIELTVKTN